MLPEWVRVQNQKVNIHKKGRPPAPTAVVVVSKKPEDSALFVGERFSIQIMQETLDREGIGRQRCFDAGAFGGRGTIRVTQVEHQAAAIANSIE